MHHSSRFLRNAAGLFLLWSTVHTGALAQQSAFTSGRGAAPSGISQQSGCHVPAKGTVRGLVLFTQTPADFGEDAGWPAGQIPTWAARYIENVRSYFSDMSGGQLQLQLDLYPQLLIIHGTESQYIALHRTLGDATKDILVTMDDTFDFAPYDQFQAAGNAYHVLPGPDQYVELIIVISRSVANSKFFPYQGISNLGFEGYIYVDNGARIIYGGTSEYADASASGLTVVQNPGTHTITQEDYAYRVTLHEFMHKLYGEGHPALLYGGLGLLSNGGGGLAMNSFERHTLGYITFKTLPTDVDTVFTLRDYVTSNDAAEIPIPQAANWHYTFEFRNRTSPYDTAPASGLYIYRVYDPPSNSQKEVHPINAGGNWQWAIGSTSKVPYRMTADPLDGFNPYDKIPINGKPYYVDGWAGDPQSPFTLQRNTFSVWGNPSSEFRFNEDTVHTNLYITVRAMTDSNATVDIRHQAPPVLSVDSPLPVFMVLRAGFPNPVRAGDAMVQLPFELAQPGDVHVSVFDALGRMVATLADGHRDAGRHTVQFQTAGLPAGTYRCVLRVASAVLTQPIVVLR